MIYSSCIFNIIFWFPLNNFHQYNSYDETINRVNINNNIFIKLRLFFLNSASQQRRFFVTRYALWQRFLTFLVVRFYFVKKNSKTHWNNLRVKIKTSNLYVWPIYLYKKSRYKITYPDWLIHHRLAQTTWWIWLKFGIRIDFMT